jgi:hypothetical protein
MPRSDERDDNPRKDHNGSDGERERAVFDKQSDKLTQRG